MTPAGRPWPGDLDRPLRIERGRITVVADSSDRVLAEALAAAAAANDSFPWLPRARQPIVVAIAPDHRRFREWTGPTAPEWGAAIAMPEEQRIVMQGRRAGSDAGDPVLVLRHELAHLALHEYLGDLPPRWFDEGYAGVAAGEWGRDEVLSTNVALVLRGVPPLDSLDEMFAGGAVRAAAAYAISYRAVADLAALDRVRGLTLFFGYWREAGRLDLAIRRAFGITQDAFEARWRTQVRRRYGGLAVFADLSLSAFFIAVIVAPLYVIRRRRDRTRMEALIEADARAERQERADAIEALLRSIPAPPPRQDAGE